jgi:hypothetical protein
MKYVPPITHVCNIASNVEPVAPAAKPAEETWPKSLAKCNGPVPQIQPAVKPAEETWPKSLAKCNGPAPQIQEVHSEYGALISEVGGVKKYDNMTVVGGNSFSSTGSSHVITPNR